MKIEKMGKLATLAERKNSEKQNTAKEAKRDNAKQHESRKLIHIKMETSSI